MHIVSRKPVDPLLRVRRIARPLLVCAVIARLTTGGAAVAGWNVLTVAPGPIVQPAVKLHDPNGNVAWWVGGGFSPPSSPPGAFFSENHGSTWDIVYVGRCRCQTSADCANGQGSPPYCQAEVGTPHFAYPDDVCTSGGYCSTSADCAGGEPCVSIGPVTAVATTPGNYDFFPVNSLWIGGAGSTPGSPTVMLLYFPQWGYGTDGSSVYVCADVTSPVLSLANDSAPGSAWVGTEAGLYAVTIIDAPVGSPDYCRATLVLPSPGGGVTAVTNDAKDNINVPATTHYAAFGPGRVKKSTDGWQTSSEMSSGLPAGVVISALALDPLNPATVYAGTRGAGIFKSLNGGAWTAIDNGLGTLDVIALAVDPVTPANVYAAIVGGLFRSTNGGGRWTDMSGLLLEQIGLRMAGIAFVPDAPTDLLVTANHSSQSGFVARSTHCQTNQDCDDGLTCTSDVCDAALPADGCRHDFSGPDSDADGIPDSCDPCPTRRNRNPDGDFDGDGVLDGCVDNCPGVPNPDQRNTDGCPSSPTGVCANPTDGGEGGDLCDACPGCVGAACCTGLTAKGLVGPAAGSVLASDPTLGSIKLDVPANTFTSPTSVAVTGVNQSAYGLGNLTSGPHVFDARFTPPGSLANPVKVTFTWRDSAPADGKVDSNPAIPEANLKVFHNGGVLGVCKAPDTNLICECSSPGVSGCPSASCPSGTCQVKTCGEVEALGCPPGAQSCCNTATNTWTVQVSSFSELLLGSDPCPPIADAKLTLTKIGAPSGDDSLTFKGAITLPAAMSFAAAAPVPNGLKVVLGDAPGATTGTVLDATLDGTSFDGTYGWKTNGKGTKWTWTDKRATPTGGFVKVLLQDKSSKQPGLVAVAVKGRKGAYAVTKAVTLGLVFLEKNACFEARFPGAAPNEGCAVKGGGTGLKCRSSGTIATPAPEPTPTSATPTATPTPTVTDTPTATPTMLPPCDSTTGPQCDGTCPNPGEYCEYANGTCFCRSYACGWDGPPGCSGECAAGGVCVDDGGGCQCAVPTQPCASATAPQCDGSCEPFEFCFSNGSTCNCVPLGCGVNGVPSFGPPQCNGECPSGSVCVDNGGSCECTE